MAVGVDWQFFAHARRDRDVEISRRGGDAIDRTLLAPEFAADDAGCGAVIVGDNWNTGRRYVLVARGGHFVRRGQVGPELEAVHAALRIAAGHFLM